MNTCSKCPEGADRWIGTQPFCRPCWLAFREPLLDKHVLPETFGGVGAAAGRRRHEYGTDVFDLCCTQCSATWCGEVKDPCPWCRRSYELLVEAHREVLAHPDLPAAGDERRQNAEVAWAKRLAQAVRAGIATEPEVRSWWNRTARRVS